MYAVEVYREGARTGQSGWTVVGQYNDRQSAEVIARDYRSRGERARVTSE